MFEERVHGLDRAVGAMAAASADMLEEVAALDHPEVWGRDGATSMTPRLAGRYSLTWSTAREWVRVAHALRELPAIARAYREGRLSWDQLRPLTKFAQRETDERLAREAPSRSAAWLWQEARRHERVREQEVEEIHRGRYLSLEWNEDKTELYLQGRFAAEQGAVLERAVVRTAEQVVIADDPFDRAGARQADALVELVTEGRGEPVPATLVVHADAAMLAGEQSTTAPWLAETESGERLCTAAVRRLACDARIEWLLESRGHPVGIGRRGRSVPGSILRALRFRDQTCQFPGCQRKQWLKVHHIQHWAHGGRTDLTNLILLCHAHHRLLHEVGWTIRGRPGRDLRFHDPTGRPLQTASEWMSQAAVSADLLSASAAG